jgi:hypothetical protein
VDLKTVAGEEQGHVARLDRLVDCQQRIVHGAA